jgi:Phosphotransferase enzyme family
MTPADLEPLSDLLQRHGVDPATEEPFPNDGWSGAMMTRLQSGDGERGFILKRDSLERDWIARATADGPILREAWFAAQGPALPRPVRAPYFGAGVDGEEVGILMPDLTGILFDWNATLSLVQLDRVLAAMAALHSHPWAEALDQGADHWTPWRERLTLICRPSLGRPGPARDAVADRILPGWDAWDRLASPESRELIAALAADPRPLLDALSTEPPTLLHGDLKLANVGIAADGAVEIVDWQMVMAAPVAVELGWFLVSNVNALPLPASDVLERYFSALDLAKTAEPSDPGSRTEVATNRARQVDLAILIGLLLRGWRKGADAEAGVTLASGLRADDDLAWWCDRAVDAADRIL